MTIHALEAKDFNDQNPLLRKIFSEDVGCVKVSEEKPKMKPKNLCYPLTD